MKFTSLHTYRLIILIVLCVYCASFKTCHGKQVIRSYWRKLKASSGGSPTFNVLDYGAKGDGKSDDTKVRCVFFFISMIFLLILKNTFICNQFYN